MRAYTVASEEALRARELLQDWKGEGFFSEAQYASLEQETPSDLRCTNVFLRVVLFLFTLLIVAAGAGLFFFVFLTGAGEETFGILALFFAAACYVAAEFAVREFRFYRHGIEEALCAASLGFLCAGVQTLLSGSGNRSEVATAIAGAALCIWCWYRFGFAYAPLAAMAFVPWLATSLTQSIEGRVIIIATLYAAGLAVVCVLRQSQRYTYLTERCSIAEALLWLGTYLAINVHLAVVYLGPRLAGGGFYWTTWVLTWCLPLLVLVRGVREKDRLVIGAGTVAAILTLATNKSYLGWERHTWDPMLLGLLLIGVALYLRRWLSQGAEGVRHAFTARRLSGKDKAWMSAGATVIGVASPDRVLPHTDAPDTHFDGGRSGGGGASSDF